MIVLPLDGSYSCHLMFSVNTTHSSTYKQYEHMSAETEVTRRWTE